MPATADLYTLGVMAKARITAITSEPAGFPKENLLDFNPDTYWKPSSTADQTIDIDLGSTQTISQFAIFINNNLESFGGTNIIALLYDNNNDGNYTATTTFAIGVINNSFGKPVYFVQLSPEPTQVGKRYWRAKLQYMTKIIELSGLFLVRKRAITVPNEIPINQRRVFHNKVIEGVGGRQMVGGINRLYSLVIPRTYLFGSETMMNILRNAFGDCRGRLWPLILREDSENYFVRFDDDELNENRIGYAIYKPTVIFNQIPYKYPGDFY